MLGKVRSRVTFANVTSIIALFVALGGASYAMVKLPANSVGTKQIKQRAVTNAKIAPNAIGGSNVRDQSLTGADIRLSTFGKVPAAASADNSSHATSADNSSHATSADNSSHANNADAATSANNALNLAGQAASAFEPRVQWAFVAQNGTIIDQSGGISVVAHTTGQYTLSFGTTVDHAALVATPSQVLSPSGRIDVEVSPCGNDAANGKADCPSFNDSHHLIVGTADSFSTTSGSQDSGFYVAVLG